MLRNQGVNAGMSALARLITEHVSCSSRNSLSLSPRVHNYQSDDDWRIILCSGILVTPAVHLVNTGEAGLLISHIRHIINELFNGEVFFVDINMIIIIFSTLRRTLRQAYI